MQQEKEEEEKNEIRKREFEMEKIINEIKR